MPVQQKFLQFPFFGPLTPDDFQHVTRAATRRAVPAQTILFQEGDAGDTFYMIYAGKVEIFSGTGEDEQTLNVLDAGEWFGELALIDDQPRSGTARTLKASVLITLPKQEFLWLVTKYPLSLFIIVSAIQHTLRERDHAYRAEAELRAEQLQQLYSTSLDITRHLERDQALSAIRERAVELLKSAGGDLYLYDEQRKVLVPQVQEFLSMPSRRIGEGCTGRAFASGEACVANPSRRMPIFELAAPIVLEERSLGVLNVYRASDGAPYQETDKTLLQLFANQAAIVIENAQLYALRMDKARLDGELNAARQVQANLIPTDAPHLANYQLAAMWEPARKVSGDFYDFIPLADGRMGIVIADVSDKGMAAALFMATARSILRASADVGGTISEIIERANRALERDATGGMFVTVFFAILDPHTHHFSYVNAGHNNPYWIHASNATMLELKGNNLAMGILDAFSYRSEDIELARGDVILFYTDGVTEATDEQEELFGEERLRRVLQENGNGTARHLLRVLDENVRAFTGAFPQSDDITVVALKRT